MLDAAGQRVLVTGASGFVGRHLCRELLRRNFRVRAVTRTQALDTGPARQVESIHAADMDRPIDWSPLLAGVDTVIHLAARVHILKDSSSDPEEDFRRVNVEATRRLAEAAAGSVRRLVFVSSVHAMSCTSDERLHEQSLCHPSTPYGQSKLQAEQGLRDVASRSGLEIAIVRPAPVYGPDHRGNLQTLFRLALGGYPLPLARLNNRRSFLYVKNFADALIACASHPQAAGETFLLSDGEDVSTPELLERLGQAADRPPWLLSTPLASLRLAGWLARRTSTVERLLGSLAVDSTRIRQRLDWTAPYCLDEGLRATAGWVLGRELPRRDLLAA